MHLKLFLYTKPYRLILAKILFFINSLSLGGAERVTVGLVNYFSKNKHDVCLATMRGSDDDFYLIDSRVKRICINLAGVNYGLSKITSNICRVRELRRILISEKPSVVVAMMTTSFILLLLASVGLPVKVFGSERNYPLRKVIPIHWALLRKLLYRFADGHISQTRKTADWLLGNVSARNVYVIPNMVSFPIPSFNPIIDPCSVIAPHRKVILAIGTKVYQKGFDLLLKIFSQLSDEWSDWDLVVLGVGGSSLEINCDYEFLTHLAKDLGISERVFFPGYAGNVVDWYMMADIFVLSSRYEGFPNVLIEAMSCGCPCIAFDCDTGPRDVIKNGVNGVLVPPDDSDALRDWLGILMADESLRNKYGQKSVDVIDEFSESKVMGLWVDALGLTKS